MVFEHLDKQRHKKRAVRHKESKFIRRGHHLSYKRCSYKRYTTINEITL